jgi:hypothetical protein
MPSDSSRNYRVFKRTCRNWEQFARARKITVQTGLSFSEARELCERSNAQRTPAQVAAGLKYEFSSSE